MRKRKSPVVLVTILVIMLVAVGIIYSPRGGGDAHAHEAQPQGQPPVETGDRPKINTSDVAAMASSSMAASGPKKAVPMGGGAGGNEPSIVVPVQQNNRPVPSDSSTSTQWYTPETKK